MYEKDLYVKSLKEGFDVDEMYFILSWYVKVIIHDESFHYASIQLDVCGDDMFRMDVGNVGDDKPRIVRPENLEELNEWLLTIDQKRLAFN